MSSPSLSSIRVEALTPEFSARAEALAARLGLPLSGEAGFALQLGPQGLQLLDLAPGAPGAVRADFLEGASAHRRLFGGGSGQMIAKAVGLKPGVRPRVLDATAGLGRDAFVLAQLGCTLDLIERQPIVAELLADALSRAQDDPEVGPIVACMHLRVGDAIAAMRALRTASPTCGPLSPARSARSRALTDIAAACRRSSSGRWG